MNIKVIIGIILIALGVAAFAVGGISFTKQEKVLQVGDLAVTAPKTERLSISPIVGGVLLIGGILVLVTSRSKA